MANAVFYSNTAQQTTLTGSISAGATSIGVAATTGFPSSTPYTLALDYGAATEELVSVTGVAGTTLTVTRGYGSTSAQSHGIGAVVRHVYDATDATAFRTHEAATAAIHGVAGTLVGTSDTQTLSNKTLTAPTINAGALSGTFTGTPTFSGDVTHTGQIILSNLLRGSRGLVTDSMYESRVTGDSFARWFMLSTGEQRWGPGNTGFDLTLQRTGAGSAQIGGILAVASSNTGVVDHLLVNTSGSTNAASNLINLKNSGTSIAAVGATGTVFSTPSGSAVDAFSANMPSGTSGDLLNLRVNGSIQSAMGSDGQFRIYGGNAPTPYTPTWGNTGGATFTTNTGYYWRVGKMVFVCVFMVVNAAGSGSGILTVTMPSNVDRSTRQCLTVHAESVGAGGSASSAIRGGECMFFTGGSANVSDRIRVDLTTGNEGNILGNDLLNGGSITIQGWYREA